MKAVEEIIVNYCGDLDSRYLIGDSRFNVKSNDYFLDGFLGQEKNLDDNVLFNKDYTCYGISLNGKIKSNFVNCAVLGFNIVDNVSDCLEIHGVKGMYNLLSPIRWDEILLNSLVDISKMSDFDAVIVIPGLSVDGANEYNYSRLEKRYDYNARSQGFLFSEKENRFILDL